QLFGHPWSTVNAQKLEFGAGTVLSVLEQGKKLIVPKVTIFNPNPKELKDHEHASFVCVASGFYPEHVSITWKVNGEKRQTYDQNKATENNDKTYSISRRLSVTKDEYFTPSNTFQCEASFPDKEIGTDSKVVNGKPACSKAKKDQYRIEVNNGKLSYIMVLCKSALYAIVVAAIMLRKKMKSSTY
uniref:Ig-like domain-containing protein n=1 Tax=Leptobrachium leishanense TaxID=445787 RepID=A0A8C5Q1P1_9ANUR